jgi:hypothetical protein
MTEAINLLIAELHAQYSDTRTNLFDVKIESKDDKNAKFSGRVLEQANLDELKQRFHEKFPELIAEYSGIEVLRKSHPYVMSVATNLTSLHAEPSWLAEQLSQLLFGWKLEILIEKGSWCYVRQEDGYLGWAYKPYLTAEQILPTTHLVTAAVLPLYDLPERTSALVTRLMVSSGVHMLQVKGAWAEVQANERGWVHLADLRAVTDFPTTEEQRRRQMVEDAFRLTGVQYLWGGGSGHGIDCSGLAQVIHRLSGITILRDADMQMLAGKPVEPPYLPGDLVFFGEKGEKKAVTHVGISLGGWQIIHSSRSRNGVYIDDIEQVPHLKESWLGGASYVSE